MATRNSTRKPISTELQLKRLKATDSTFDVKVANTPGLVVRISKSGAKSFRWDRGAGHKPRIITHGRFPAISLKQARDLHTKVKQQHSEGILNLAQFEASLALEERAGHAKKNDLKDPNTVGELAEMFYADRILPKRKRPEKARRVLDKDILPYIGEMKISAVRPLVVRKVVKIVVDRGSTAHAGSVLGLIKQLFRYGVSMGVMEDNPAQSLEADMLGIESNQRNRTLSSQDIKALWGMLDKDSNFVAATALRLLLLLGIRSGELRLTQWKDVDLDKGLLTIPVENQKLTLARAKMANDFLVPLDDFVVSLFRELQGLNDVWVFPNRKGVAFDNTVMPRMVKRVNQGEIEPFTPHDIRRSVRIGLSKLKVKPHIAERCLNHAQPVIEETYDTHDYLYERREALEQWSQRVQVILGKHENVVPMEVAG